MSYTRNHFSPSTAPAEHRNLRKGDNGHFSGRKAKASRQQKPHWNHADALIRTETYQQREFGDSYQTQFEHDHPELEETNRNFKKRDVYRVTRPLNLSETEPWKSVVRSSEDSAYESADDTADEKRGKGKEVPREQLLVHQGVYVYPPGYVYEFQCGPNEALEFDVSRYKPSGWNQAMEHAGTTTMPDSEIYLAGKGFQEASNHRYNIRHSNCQHGAYALADYATHGKSTLRPAPIERFGDVLSSRRSTKSRQREYDEF